VEEPAGEAEAEETSASDEGEEEKRDEA
jgi:hypothetical protein